MSRSRILHVSDGFPALSSEVGGAEVIAERIMQVLDKEGFMQGLATVAGKNQSSDSPYPVYFFAPLEIPDVGWLAALKSQLFPFDPLVEDAFGPVLDDFKPDVVFLHNIKKIGLSIVRQCAERSIPIVALVYDYIYFCPTGMFVDAEEKLCRLPGAWCGPCHMAQAKRLASWSQRLMPLRDRLFSPLLNKIDRFVTLSRASRDLLVEAGVDPRRIEVVPQPLSVESAGQTVESDPNRILFVGWGQHRKGLLIVVRALALLEKPFVFEAIGALVDPGYVGKVEEELRNAGLDPKQCLRGKVDDEELRQAMGRAAIVVVAEQWENMSPAVLHEAMAAGKVVIAGAVGGIPEFIDSGVDGFLVTFNEPSAFAEQIGRVLGCRELQLDIGRKAVERARKNTRQETIAGDYLRMIERIRNSHDRRLRQWLDNGPCVIICGGAGTRLGEEKMRLPKSLVQLNGKPILKHIMDFWAPYTKEFILVISQETREIANYCDGVEYQTICIVEGQSGQGIARALLETRTLLRGRFVMVLGDCLYKGPLDLPEGMDRGIGVFATDNVDLIRNNYSVQISPAGLVEKVQEKPRQPVDGFCGMGVYFLDGGIWEPLLNTKPDENGVVQITSVLQRTADFCGLFPVFFEGDYLNINYPADLEQARKRW